MVGDVREESADDEASSIIVTGSSMRARQEDLGDLKLYRIPEPVTVAANSQKQVAFLEQPGVRVQLVYRSRLEPDYDGDIEPARRVLVTRNRTDEGLGLPLPGGRRPALRRRGRRGRSWSARARSRDRAVGEDVEIEIGEAPGVTSAKSRKPSPGDDWDDYRPDRHQRPGRAGPLRGGVRPSTRTTASGRAPGCRAATGGRSGR